MMLKEKSTIPSSDKKGRKGNHLQVSLPPLQTGSTASAGAGGRVRWIGKPETWIKLYK